MGEVSWDISKDNAREIFEGICKEILRGFSKARFSKTKYLEISECIPNVISKGIPGRVPGKNHEDSFRMSPSKILQRIFEEIFWGIQWNGILEGIFEIIFTPIAAELPGRLPGSLSEKKMEKSVLFSKDILGRIFENPWKEKKIVTEIFGGILERNSWKNFYNSC